ncbi:MULTISPECIES: cytochrome c oxidase subunit 3 [Leptolyngbya]|jgi:cytochrome c oxidase subunit 3|uniref:Cytochrome c oxidase subunit III n=1 Tax=Leptolyngbya boryana NIES-2135 TaxID=1973484 RepID=A0A1Z4JLM1_LEPBY|nr:MULTISPECIES: heme-copper oxidase subunit III [Leptolyngbya]BAY57665.1 cytochrome c oxidase subunit III [Leptolyngbya boryana NIES-2135]MBD2367619.1 heme-copper oxidase subunit III [Leptolyngbya sp. FACHB-161]MBD2374143.1 heme-copper oxidase subunit III [Leptolyngbya sp. FACHB-238]MBD2398768.1 heme-copper oxidase subunit III [Leptolyngbya sp. FACHB-239]MBD2404992.1 heme-copper oxidase subunit III [Leptolyngbya sp. FACHB-402]
MTERAIAQDVEAQVRSHQEHDEAGNSKFGFIVFLLSESVIFLSFFAGYIIYKTQTLDWYPPGVTGLDVDAPRINTIVLVSSSFVIYVAERYLHDKKLWGFRLFLIATMAMGAYFLYGQAVEWSSLSFGLTDGLFGGTFYLLTGFHGLHVLTGLLLQTLMLGRSFIPGNYDNGSFGVEATSLFWHFVDVIWIVLFILIYVWQ